MAGSSPRRKLRWPTTIHHSCSRKSHSSVGSSPRRKLPWPAIIHHSCKKRCSSGSSPRRKLPGLPPTITVKTGWIRNWARFCEALGKSICVCRKCSNDCIRKGEQTSNFISTINASSVEQSVLIEHIWDFERQGSFSFCEPVINAHRRPKRRPNRWFTQVGFNQFREPLALHSAPAEQFVCDPFPPFPNGG
jgi:hypothetical protein